MIAIAMSCEELKVEWLAGGRDNRRDSGIWIYQALPKWVLQGICEHTCGAIRWAPLDSSHILFHVGVSRLTDVSQLISCDI